jgi:hypothetical protein
MLDLSGGGKSRSGSPSEDQEMELSVGIEMGEWAQELGLVGLDCGSAVARAASWILELFIHLRDVVLSEGSRK